ncbi:MAG TPA: PP0621 family protein [Gallionella sp.]|nr:PP0621 family protein [Gallionella sp.]
MSRLFLLFAIALAVYLLVKSYRRSSAPQAKPDAEDMVRCAQCGVHFPKSEGVMAGGHYFCGVAHRDAYRN